jgi:hypothetical protein
MATLGLASVQGRGHTLEALRGFLLIAGALAIATNTAAVKAASFGSVRYDSGGDQLVVTMIYDGTTRIITSPSNGAPAASSVSQTSRRTRQ